LGGEWSCCFRPFCLFGCCVFVTNLSSRGRRERDGLWACAIVGSRDILSGVGEMIKISVDIALVCCCILHVNSRDTRHGMFPAAVRLLLIRMNRNSTHTPQDNTIRFDKDNTIRSHEDYTWLTATQSPIPWILLYCIFTVHTNFQKLVPKDEDICVFCLPKRWKLQTSH
jgi:hypothetical protein